LLHGAQGAAGMMGHIPVSEANQTICRCGNRGCLDVVAATGALIEEAIRAAGEGRSRLLTETLSGSGSLAVNDIGLAAQRGDAFSADLLSRCGRQVGTVLAALTNAFNPAVIVLGGEVAETGDILLAAIREAVYRRAHPLVTRDLRIIQSQLGNSAGLVGSALTLADEFFAAGFLREWIAFGSPLGHPRIAAHLAELAAEAVGASSAGPGAAAE
jgi:predicted NBD/HSP70 family sugar kinase